MINSEPYNKFINTKDGIDTESYLVYLKQDNLDMYNSFLNLQSESINNWSSKKYDKLSWRQIMNEAVWKVKSG